MAGLWLYLPPPINEEERLRGDGFGHALVSSGAIAATPPIHNIAYVTPNNFLGAALAPTIGASVAFMVMIAMSTGGIFRATITRGGNTQVTELNNGVALVANALYTFSPILAYTGDTINFRYSINATIMHFKVFELIPS